VSKVHPVFAPRFDPLKVTVVIVLYRMLPEGSPAYQSILAARQCLSPDAGEARVMLWDNSPTADAGCNLPAGVHYIADENNSGLATGYNRALAWAAEQGSDWLLTLDQDTEVQPDFFVKMAAAARESSRFAGIGAIVPQIAAGGRKLSPNYFLFGAVPRWYPAGYVGVPGESVFAFNSGAMLSIDALKQVGGYDPRFWLDNSDAMIFSKLHEHGKRVYVAGDIQVDHEFSMKDMERRMSPERYRNAMLAETAFWDLRMNRAAGWERTLRLALRLVKQRLRKDSVELRRITLQALFRRLFFSRRRRLAEWGLSTSRHVDGSDVAPGQAQQARRQLKVSACMAAYNGGDYVEPQLQSILAQLKPTDEIVIVDDGSTDGTVARIAQIRDTRIRILQHDKNRGVVATFEDALRSASGDVLFLCDDDDVWAPTKVQRFLEVFGREPKARIVQSRVRMIDENDRPIPDSRINRHGRFVAGFWRNLFMNHYQGSAMALRSSLLGHVLPFPARKLFLHDAWIGTRNDLMGGGLVFIDEDLLFYRRHGKNASQAKPSLQRLRSRAELVLAHMVFSFRSSARPSRNLP
jgi:GT2 family glycosyltransferase